MTILPLKRTSLPAEIASRLRVMIFSGEFKPGDRLPCERELASMFGTNRNTLREALRSLEMVGLIEIRQGAGIFVKDVRIHGNLSLLNHFIKEGYKSPYALEVLEDMFLFRRRFFQWVIPEAVEKCEWEDLDFIQNSLREILKLKGTPQSSEIFTHDTAIFRRLIASTRRAFYMWTFNTIAEMGWNMMKVAGENWIFPEFYFHTMKRFVKKVLAKDVKGVMKTLETHLKRMDNFTLKLSRNILSQG